MNKKTQSIAKKILARIYGHGRGYVFTPMEFQDLGGSKAIRSVLSRHVRVGIIRRLGRGLYDYPRKHPDLGELAPATEDIVEALAGRDASRLQPAGAYAANMLGLSSQVPMKIVYLTDGRSRAVQVGNRRIILKRTTPRNMAAAGNISGLIIQALRHLGQKHVDAEVVSRLDSRLDNADRKQLMKDIRYAPAWIADIFRRLAAGDEKNG